MSDPLRPIHDATTTIASRSQRRANVAVEHRSAAAAETIADELTMIRAEMSVMRDLLALIQAKIK
jgi:hypothetical protein